MSMFSSYQGRFPAAGSIPGVLGSLFLLAMLNACGGAASDDSPAFGSDDIPALNPDVAQDDNPETDSEELPSDPQACGPDSQKQWAYDSMLDYYLFYDKVPDVDPTQYASASDLVRRLRFEERDRYSSVGNATTSTLFYEAGRVFGLGIRFKADAEGAPRVILVEEDGPFGQTDVERGDIIVAIDGVNWDELSADSDFEGSPDNPVSTSWTIQKNMTGELFTVQVTAKEYSVSTVAYSDVFPNSATQGNIGYLVFNQFLQTAGTDLNAVFDQFQEQNIEELILDLRYNNGGLVSIATQLASQIAGNARAGELLYEYRRNDKYTNLNSRLSFSNNQYNLGLSRVIVLTSPATASASEIVIAGLMPYLDVFTIGGTTSGKSYFSRGQDRCDKRLNLMLGEGFNANDYSVFGGVEPTCPASDDVTRPFGIGDDGMAEGQLQAGIDYIIDGSCPAQLSARSSGAALAKSSDSPQRGFMMDEMLPGGAVVLD